MKPIAVLTLALVGLWSVAVAQDAKKDDAPKPAAEPAGPFMRMYVNSVPMASKLDLSDEQKNKINKIKTGYREKIKKLLLEERKMLEAVLTPEQKTKMLGLEADVIKAQAERAEAKAKAEADAAAAAKKAKEEAEAAKKKAAEGDKASGDDKKATEGDASK